MSLRVESITDELRAAVGVVDFTPTDFAVWLRLPLCPISHCAPCLRRDLSRIEYDDTKPYAVQQQQIARAACAYALLKMGCIADVTPTELVEALFGMQCDERVQSA